MSKGSIILVDSNMLNSLELLEYFSTSKNNKIVLPDYLAIEAYKSENFEAIARSLETISKYPQQVIILHEIKIITKLKDHSEILKWKFVNKEHTKLFKNFCRGLDQAQRGNIQVKEYILEQAKAANRIVEYVMEGASELAESFKEIETKLFDKDEVLRIRKSETFTQDMMKKLYFLAERLGNDVYLNHPSHKRLPSSGVNKHSFTFRYGVAVALLGIKWISRGNAQDVKAERLRNDLIDTTLVAYSTYYDDLLTNDQDMIWLKVMTDRFLDVLP